MAENQQYKQGQGVLVRRAAFWVLAVLIVWGGQSLYTWLINTFDFCKKLILESGPYLDGWQIPVLEQRFDIGFLIAWGFVGFGLWFLHRCLNKQKAVDFLVDTDEELKKVTWPSWADAKNSSLIVLVFVVFLALYLWGSDVLLTKVFSLLLGA